jgi:hypothetical protein
MQNYSDQLYHLHTDDLGSLAAYAAGRFAAAAL